MSEQKLTNEIRRVRDQLRVMDEPGFNKVIKRLEEKYKHYFLTDSVKALRLQLQEEENKLVEQQGVYKQGKLDLKED